MSIFSIFFFFNDTATTEIYTLSLHDALPICQDVLADRARIRPRTAGLRQAMPRRSEEHTSELQSPCNLVCRLLLEKKKHYNLPIVTRRSHARTPHPNYHGLSQFIDRCLCRAQ